MNRPAATCAIPAVVSMRLAPHQARTAPAILMALGMVGISVLGLNLGIFSRHLIGIISISLQLYDENDKFAKSLNNIN